MTQNPSNTAVVLFQLGGPDSLDAVEPFLYNLFRDPDIIDLPGAFLFRRLLARMISSRRAPKVQELYKRIGGRSPILKQTRLQAERLKDSLARHNVRASVHIAMRYWHPMTAATAKEIAGEQPKSIVLLPLYPHFSKTTTGSSLNEWNRAVKKLQCENLHAVLIEHYFDHPLYVEALVEHITRALHRLPEPEREKIHLVFSAHGTPMKLVKDGDPYSHHIRKTYELVIEKGNFGLEHTLCFQSKVGPQQWLKPSLVETIERLASEKTSHVLVIPIAFVSDHIETLSEINMEAKAYAKKLGIRYFDMMPALLMNEKFVACLTDLVLQKLKTKELKK
ncbi:MAG: ferrochelatase [Bacteroidota bacterium]|nr:ferrochelatase [Bacteroidota bacterium]